MKHNKLLNQKYMKIQDNKDIKKLPKYIDKESLIKQVALAKKLTSPKTEFIKIDGFLSLSIEIFK